MHRDTPASESPPTLRELLRAKEALEAQAAALREQIALTRTAERSAAIERIQALMAAHGVSLQDLRAPAGDAIPETAAAAPVPAPLPPPPPPRAKPLFSAKYRDKETGNAWSGNGETPSWLRRALADGRSLDEFLV